MKTNYWWMVAVSVGLTMPHAWADDQLPGTAPRKDAPKPAPAGDARKQPDEKSGAGAPAASRAAEPVAGPGPAIVSQRNVNVRGRAAINSEVITRLNRGDRVNVIEEVTLSKPRQDEPAKWAKIALPTNAAVWAHSSFIDQTNNTVIPRRLNLRSGPGENYSIIGRIEKGAIVKPIDSKGEWVKLEPPANAYGFVAAHLLAREPAAPIVAATPTPEAPKPEPPPIETPVATAPTPAPAEAVVATPATPAPAPATPPAIETPAAPEPAITPAPEPTEPEETLVKRIVTREGIVERSVSIQAPTYFILQSLGNRRAINYLYSPSTNVMLKDYRGQRIIVTGEELLDERWPNTPVIEVEKIEAVP